MNVPQQLLSPKNDFPIRPWFRQEFNADYKLNTVSTNPATYWGGVSFQIWVNFTKVVKFRNWEQASFSPDSIQYGSCMTLKRKKRKITLQRICTYWLSGRAGRENIWPEVMAYGPSAKYFPVRPDLTQSISILLYDHRAFPFSFFLFFG